MTESREAPKKTRWGCLSLPIAATLLFAAARIHDEWYERQPLAVHLRNVFKESGFEVPDYVTDLDGSKGFVDFQGDYSACVTFTVRPDEIGRFMDLPAKLWKTRSDFKPVDKQDRCGDFEVPAGSFVIEDWASSEYHCKYAVNKTANRIYFYRSST